MFPLGNFLSIRLQQFLSEAIAKAGNAAVTSRGWWKRTFFNIPDEIFLDVRLLRGTLVDLDNSDVWRRPIGLLIRRAPTCNIRSDASYDSLGGWSETFQFCWRITTGELKSFGFATKLLNSGGQPDNIYDPAGLHINILEFVGVIINVWLLLWFVRRAPDKRGGHIAEVLADNTSALSWMHYAARCHRPEVRHLAFFLQYLLTMSGTAAFLQVTGCHIPGVDSGPADALSRPRIYPTIVSAIAAYSQLQACSIYRLPSELVSLIAEIIACSKIEVSLVQRMTRVLTLAPVTFVPGASGKEFSGVFQTLRRKPR